MEKHISKFNENFIKHYNEDSDKGYILEVDIKYPKNLHNMHVDLPFLPERMKIKKCNKLVCNLYDKKQLCCTCNNFNINHGLILKKVHRVVQFSYIKL